MVHGILFHKTDQNFNRPLCDLRLNGESLKEGRLLRAERSALGWHGDINSCNGSSFRRCSNLIQETQSQMHA